MQISYKISDESFFSFFWSAFNKDGSSGTMTVNFWKWTLEFDLKYYLEDDQWYFKNEGWYYTDIFLKILPLPKKDYGKWWGFIYFSFRRRHQYRTISPGNIKKTKLFAEYAHKDQKYGSYPYSKHLQDVYDVLLSFGVKDKDIRCSAWLHDTVEDTFITYEDISSIFSEDITDIVYAVTNEKGKNRKERNSKTYPKIRNSLKGTKLKLADRIANVTESLSNNPDLFLMYRNEHPSFKEGIYNPKFKDETLDRMWEHLDKLMGDLKC